MPVGICEVMSDGLPRSTRLPCKKLQEDINYPHRSRCSCGCSIGRPCEDLAEATGLFVFHILSLVSGGDLSCRSSSISSGIL